MIGVACIKEMPSTGHSGVCSGDSETTAVVIVLPIEFELPLRRDLDRRN